MQILLIDFNFSSFSGGKLVHPKIMELFFPATLWYHFTLLSLVRVHSSSVYPSLIMNIFLFFTMAGNRKVVAPEQKKKKDK